VRGRSSRLAFTSHHNGRSLRDRRIARYSGAEIVIAAYHILVTGKPYRDLGPAYLDTQRRRRTQHHRVHRLEQMGYQVTLTLKAA
jgi:hypothetical protein